MSDRPETPLLDTVQYPADLRGLSKDQLPQVADELRSGRLLRLFGQFDVRPQPGEAVVYAAYLPNRRQSSKVRAFVRFLEARLQAAAES